MFEHGNNLVKSWSESNKGIIMLTLKFAMFFVFLLSLNTISSNYANASDLNTRQSALYPPSVIEVSDEFLAGASSSGNIGSLGWSQAGGSVAAIAPSGSNLGVIQLDTSAVINTIARLNGFGGSSIILSFPFKFVWVAKLNTNDANTTIRLGTGVFSSNPPADGVYFEKLDADTNWFCVTRSGGVQTRVDSTVAIDTNFHKFTGSRNSSGTQFMIDSTAVCGTTSTNVPTAAASFGAHIINSVAASKTVNFDYFSLSFSGLSR